MRDFFTRGEDATWPEQGRLHVYALANDQLREAARRYHAALDGIAAQQGLGLQPLEYLHFTVQMLLRTIDEVPQHQSDELVSQLRTRLVGIEPITLRVGPAQASSHAVELWVSPEADERWRDLVAAVRQECSQVLGRDALPEVDSNGTPHSSIGYGIGDGDSGLITRKLKAVRHPLIDVRVSELHLVAVTQHPGQGQFRWEPVAALPLGG